MNEEQSTTIEPTQDQQNQNVINTTTVQASLKTRSIIQIVVLIIAAINLAVFLYSSDKAECGFFGTSSNEYCTLTFMTMFALWPLVAISGVILPIINSIYFTKNKDKLSPKDRNKYLFLLLIPVYALLIFIIYYIIATAIAFSRLR